MPPFLFTQVAVEQQASYRALLEIRGLPALILATTMSRLAGRIFSLMLVLFALTRFSSPVLAGWLTFAAIAPGLAISPIAGAFLDRAGPTTAVQTDFIASALLATAMSVAGLAGWGIRLSCVGPLDIRPSIRGSRIHRH